MHPGASEEDISVWFSERAAVRPVTVHIPPELASRTGGEVFIEFATCQDRARALALHRTALPWGRLAELFPASQQEFLLSLSASPRAFFPSQGASLVAGSGPASDPPTAFP